MPGVIIILLVLVVVIPVGFLITMGVVAAVLSWTVKTEVDDDFVGHRGSGRQPDVTAAAPRPPRSVNLTSLTVREETIDAADDCR